MDGVNRSDETEAETKSESENENENDEQRNKWQTKLSQRKMKVERVNMASQ